jgi:hypothetical protein
MIMCPRHSVLVIERCTAQPLRKLAAHLNRPVATMMPEKKLSAPEDSRHRWGLELWYLIPCQQKPR